MRISRIPFLYIGLAVVWWLMVLFSVASIMSCELPKPTPTAVTTPGPAIGELVHIRTIEVKRGRVHFYRAYGDICVAEYVDFLNYGSSMNEVHRSLCH